MIRKTRVDSETRPFSPPCSDEIDLEVLPIVEYMRSLGLETFISCGGHRNAYHGAGDRTTYGKFYVEFFGTEKMSINDFIQLVSSKSKESSLKVRRKGTEMARFSGKLKDFSLMLVD